MTSTAVMKAHQAKLISTGNGRAPICQTSKLHWLDECGWRIQISRTSQLHSTLGFSHVSPGLFCGELIIGQEMFLTPNDSLDDYRHLKVMW